MKHKKILAVLPLFFFATSLASCGGSDDYDKKWKPGPDALDCEQPTLKNPKGKTTTLNEIRKSQNRTGLPAQGEANLLVVPINFKDDDIIQNQVGNEIDITISEEDREALKELYFGTTKEGSYPSVQEFYKTSSFNKLNLSGVVSPLVTLPETYRNYLVKTAMTSKKDVYNEIVTYVYDYLFEQTKTYYLGDFDSDDDKRVDSITLVMNYPYDISFQNDALDESHLDFTSLNNVFFTKDFAEPEKSKINSYAMISDCFRQYYYNDRDAREYIRLVGQMLGLDNYEDTTINPNTGTIRAPLGYTDMNSGGIGDHNPFSKYQLGWIEPKFISASDISDEGLKIKLKGSINSGEAIILHTGDKNPFSEYLMLDFYTPFGVNALDSMTQSIYGTTTFSKASIRVFQVDARLVRGFGDSFYDYNGKIDLNAKVTLDNGIEVPYIYDYAYSNNSVNKYASSGYRNYPLVSILSKYGINRHLTYFNTEVTDDDMFLKNDSFGSADQVEGFYKDFAFHGNGLIVEKLGISFTVNAIANGEATITLRRTNA